MKPPHFRANTAKDALRLILFVRPATPEDLAFVMDSWVKSLTPSPNAESQALHGHDVKAVLDVLARSRTLVACDQKAHDTVLGWICCAPPDRVHYLFVRDSMRRRGIATCLLRAAQIQATDVLYSFVPIPELGSVLSARRWRYEPSRTAARHGDD